MRVALSALSEGSSDARRVGIRSLAAVIADPAGNRASGVEIDVIRCADATSTLLTSVSSGGDHPVRTDLGARRSCNWDGYRFGNGGCIDVLAGVKVFPTSE
jgi:hypothetical protein